jgi:DNA-binding response OmpR family regulator
MNAEAMKTILIVEDEHETADLYSEMLQVSGFRVLKAADTHTAMGMLDKEPPDVVLLDIMMPDISGLEVVGYIRREPKLEHIPVIIVSARTLPKDIQTGLDAGAKIYLTKPVSFLELKKAVETVLAP